MRKSLGETWQKMSGLPSFAATVKNSFFCFFSPCVRVWLGIKSAPGLPDGIFSDQKS
jgi:hypothetical protein